MDLTNTIKSLNGLVDSLARQLRPTDYREMLSLAAELWITCPPYRQGIMKGTSFFMTELQVTGKEGSEDKIDEIDQARSLLNERFAATEQAALVLQESVGFGGACAYLQFPIRKIVTCKCGYTMELGSAMETHGVTFDMNTGEYRGVCPSCDAGLAALDVSETKIRDQAKSARLMRIPLALCEQKYNPLTNERELLIDCSQWEAVAEGVRSGDPLFHRSTPQPFIDSVRTKSKLRMSDKYFHYVGYQDASLIDDQMRGWSLPPFFYAFPDVVSILLLQKYNQTILSDYISPNKYIAPPANVGAARNVGGETFKFDPTHASSGTFGQFRKKMAGVVRGMRDNPGKTAIFPFPVEFGYMGIDGTQLLRPELLQHYIDSLMWSMGIPSEFYRGGMDASVATPSMYAWTLYVRFWQPLVSNINRLNQWVTDRITSAMSWPDMKTKLVPPVMHSSPEMLMVMQQQKMAGELSRSTFDRMLGVDSKYEEQTIRREQRDLEDYISSDTRKSERKNMLDQMLADVSPDMQALVQVQQGQATPAAGGQDVLASMAGAPGSTAAGVPAGPPAAPMNPGAPPPMEGAPGAGVTPAEQPAMDNVKAKAAQTAQQIFMQFPNTAERGAYMREMSEREPTFAMFVQEALQEIEAQAEKQGLDMARGGGM